MQTENTTLNKLRNIIWPISYSELKLFLPMGLMMLCMLFNFGSLRSIKDSLVVPNIGAEAISFLKLWFVLPSTIMFTVLYVRLSNMFNYEHLFYIILSSFLAVFALFTYVLFPNQDIYHPSKETISFLISSYPNFKWFIYIFAKWSYALMYVFCDLWSVVIINLLFWQYANHIFDTKSAKRFYPILGILGNLGLILAGNVLTAFSDLSRMTEANILDYSTNITFQCENVLQPIMQSIIFAGITAMILYRYINNHVLKKVIISKEFSNFQENTKTKLSLHDSIKLLLTSKYVGHLVLLLLCYGLIINIVEGPWKSKIRELYPNTIDYVYFMGNFNIYMGISSIIFMIIGSNILRRFTWLTSALITPIMITCTGAIFFIFIIFADKITFFCNIMNPIYFAVIIGAAQNILSKSTKYSLFDATKEMAYIPLSLELRTKGKATVEVIGFKLGKALAAFIQSSFFILLPMASFDSVISYLLGVFVITSIFWIWNVKSLNKEYLKLRHNQNEDN